MWQINTLEVEFLCRIHFSLAVFPDQYEAFYNELRNLGSVPSLRERSASSHASCIESVSIPAIVNIAPSGCPLLKYVFTPQEQQRKEAYYRQCEQQRQKQHPPFFHRFTLHRGSNFDLIIAHRSCSFHPFITRMSEDYKKTQNCPLSFCANSR